MKFTELFSQDELDVEIMGGWVKVQDHPTLPLTILNYTDKATYERRWNAVTLHCRGLIINWKSEEIVARGPRKFFNYGEPSATEYPLDTPVRVSRKEDGSLGIGWYYVDADEDCHWGIATRGSFTSEQAAHATKLVRENEVDSGHYEVMPDSLEQYVALGVSYIGEIVYPENRIVLDYAGRDEVIPLGTVSNLSGVVEWRPWGYNGQDNSVISLAEALARPIPDDEEGYVLDILDRDTWETIDHLKLKGDRYKELHAAIFGLSERAVWEQLVEGTVHDFIEALPDEVQPWAQAVYDRLSDEYEAYYYLIHYVHGTVRTITSRREQAQYLQAKHKDVMSPVFNLLDGKVDRMTEWVWKKIKPEHVPFSATKPLESASI